MINAQSFQSLLSLAIKNITEKELYEFDALETKDVSFELNIENNINNIIKSNNRKSFSSNIVFVLKKALIACIIVMMLSSLLGMIFPDIRDAIINFITQYYEDYISIHLQFDRKTDFPSIIETKYEPKYGIEKYKKEIYIDIPMQYYIGYSNGDSTVLTYSQKISTNVENKIDSNVYNIKETYVNKHKAILFQYSCDSDNILIWNDTYYTHTLSGYFTENELIKIAESVYS